MRISFELEQTLLTVIDEFPTETQDHIQKVLRFEKLRLGAVELMIEILEKKHEIWIYTNSSRPKNYVYELFLRHGIKISGVINRKKHITTLNIEKRTLAKFPPDFGIDIHIDNAENVRIDGDIFGFRTIIVNPQDKSWTDEIKKELFSVPVG